MASIPIHNETEYPLTDEMTQQIIRDAQEHFGEKVGSIRVQYGIQRHAFNARTREVRYAFSPNDFGLVPAMPTAPERPRSRRRSPRIDEGTEEAILPAPSEDVEVDTEEQESRETSLESIEEGRDEDEEEDDFKLDNQNDDEEDEEDDESFLENDANDA
jgi:hypothetical protein